jgi:flagellar motility protein MotE (MotC chaperone)
MPGKKNPFEDDDDIEESKAPEVEVEDEDEEVTPEEPVAARPSRKERRAERGAVREENERLRAREAELDAENRRLHAEAAVARAMPQQHQGPDPLERDIEAVDQDIRQLHESAQANWNKWTQAERDGAQRKLREFERKKAKVYRDMDERETGPRQPQITPEQQAANAVRYMVRQKNPDVFNDKRAYAYADAEFKKRLALGQVETPELMQECIDEARDVVLRGSSQRSNDVKHKFTGQRGGPGSGGSKSTVVKATQELKAIAKAAYPQLEPAQAMQKWANENGKRYNELMNSKRDE